MRLSPNLRVSQGSLAPAQQSGVNLEQAPERRVRMLHVEICASRRFGRGRGRRSLRFVSLTRTRRVCGAVGKVPGRAERRPCKTSEKPLTKNQTHLGAVKGARWRQSCDSEGTAGPRRLAGTRRVQERIRGPSWC